MSLARVLVFFKNCFFVLCLCVLSCQGQKIDQCSFHLFTSSWRWSGTGHPGVNCLIQLQKKKHTRSFELKEVSSFSFFLCVLSVE